jgi:photosystem II stability/assembly factor-like uncharacterized protein
VRDKAPSDRRRFEFPLPPKRGEGQGEAGRRFPAALALVAATVSSWLPQQTPSNSELRGLSALDPTHAWASGSGGTVLRMADGQKWEKLLAPPGGEALDFRDVEALNEWAVVLMSAGPGDASRIYRSADGGATWTLAHTNPEKDGFYDAIAFFDAKDGLVLGDPVKGKFRVRATHDGGATWASDPGQVMPAAWEGEGAFAASGTCLFALKGGNEAWFVTGGAKEARVFHTADRGRTWTVASTPAPAGNASSGLFSVAFLDAQRGFAAGGDYKQPQFQGLNGIRTEDGGATWTAAPLSATGFYSAVVSVPGAPTDLVAVGLAGEAISHDAGRTWTKTGEAPMNAAAITANGAGWAVGPKGTALRLTSSSPRAESR